MARPGIVVARHDIGDALGSQLVSTIAATGMFSRCASWIAMSSLLVSITKIMSGRPPISLIRRANDRACRARAARSGALSSCRRLHRRN